MPKSVSQSKVLNDLKSKAKGAWEDSRNVAAKPKGQIQLPGGIRKGIARMIRGELTSSEPNEQGTYPKVVLTFIIREPIDYEGVQQRKYYNFYDRKTNNNRPGKTVKEVLDELCSDLQLVGIQTAGTEIDDLPKLLVQLGTDKPYFEYSTWKPPQNEDGSESNTQIFIQKVAVDYTPTSESPEETGDATPEPATDETPVPEPAPSSTPKPRGPKPRGPVAAPAPEPEPEPEPVPEPEPEDSRPAITGGEQAIPCVEDEYYCDLPKIGKVVVAVTEVQEDAKTVSVRVVETGQKWNKIAWSKLTGE